MKYTMLGGDDASTAEKLAASKGNVAWSYLKPHYETGVLFFVDPELALESVGEAISENQTSRVEAWLKSGEMVKISELHALQWADDAPEFEALVVSPFVLCRPLPS